MSPRAAAVLVLVLVLVSGSGDGAGHDVVPQGGEARVRVCGRIGGDGRVRVFTAG